ncbi:MAG: prepilin-type N-terminal cleavage/methylation domain-containing protein, partial [Patescibacteria group bacterium]
MSRHQDKYNSREAGFTLVEALVSLVLLSTALVPTFILATDAIRLSGRIRNSLIASNLAQEGVEIVRALRDANWFAGQPFDTGLTLCAQGCQVAWDSSSLTP